MQKNKTPNCTEYNWSGHQAETDLEERTLGWKSHCLLKRRLGESRVCASEARMGVLLVGGV